MTGADVYTLRLAHHWTLKQMAAVIDSSATAIWRWEHGTMAVPERFVALLQGLPPPDTMTGAELVAFRVAHGWSQRQVADALAYGPSTLYEYESGRRPVPARIVAWVQSFPPVPVSRNYHPSPSGLRQWFLRCDIRVREFAEFCRCDDRSVARWLKGHRPLPLPIAAWLKAGAPRVWLWAPPELPNVPSMKSKPTTYVPEPTTPRTSRRGVPILRLRLQGNYQPRPRRINERSPRCVPQAASQ